jgi:hypothetical protein
MLAAARDPIGPPSDSAGEGPGAPTSVRSALLGRSWCGPTDRSSGSMRAAWLLRLVLVWSARRPGFVTGAGRFPPRLGRPQREARSRPCGRARPGVPARPVTAGRRGRRGARSDPAGRDAPARSALGSAVLAHDSCAASRAMSEPSAVCLRGCSPFSSSARGEGACARTRRIAEEQEGSSSSAASDVDRQHLMVGVIEPLSSSCRLHCRTTGHPGSPPCPACKNSSMELSLDGPDRLGHGALADGRRLA